MQDSAAVAGHEAAPDTTPLPLRHDTILGVCEAIGRDFGFNPNWLRVAFAVSIYWAPALVVVAYLALGLVVAFAHWMAPTERAAPAVIAATATGVDLAVTDAPRTAANQTERELAAA